MNDKKIAFTLAEVLITLGIIGVVAAMTIPNLVTKYKHKALEAQFKKSYANFYNAFNKAMMDYPSTWDDEDKVNPYPELAHAIYKEYSDIKNIDSSEINSYVKNLKTYTLSKAVRPECNQIFRNIGTVITPDGSVISVSQNCGCSWVVIDINGLNKGPNAYGHDLFVFTISKTGIIAPATSEVEGNYDENGKQLSGYNHSEETQNKCSKNTKSLVNGITCSQYAVSDTCPEDDKKSYWECLP